RSAGAADRDACAQLCGEDPQWATGLVGSAGCARISGTRPAWPRDPADPHRPSSGRMVGRHAARPRAAAPSPYPRSSRRERGGIRGCAGEAGFGAARVPEVLSMEHESATVDVASMPDLEATAELPALDAGTYAAAHPEFSATDTWVSPSPPALRALPDEGSSLRQHRRLEDDLRTLAENLRELEDRLTHKGERLAEIERELE